MVIKNKCKALFTESLDRGKTARQKYNNSFIFNVN